MGAYLKYFIPLLFVVLTALAFQNCGNTLFGNGDPYESEISIDDGMLLPDIRSIDDVVLPPGFTTNQTYLPLTSESSLILGVKLGSLNGVQTAYVIVSDGRYKGYPWLDQSTPLILNDPIKKSLTVVSLELSSDKEQLQITLLNQGQSVTEILSPY